MALIIQDDVPDFSFVIVENKKEPSPFQKWTYTSNPPRLRSVGTVNNILDMHELMAKTLDIIRPYNDCRNPSSTGSHKSYTFASGIYFAPDFPDFLLPRTDPGYNAPSQVPINVITWGTVRKEPGTVSGPPFRGTQEIKPRHREFVGIFKDETRKYLVTPKETTLDAYDSLYTLIDVEAQLFDNLVQYNIWSKSNYEVERLREWFESDYMDNYIGMFREAGIVNMYFNRQVRDDTLVQMKNGYHLRSVLYYVRTERVKLKTIVPIKRVNFNVRTNDLEAISKQSYDQSIESDLEEIMRKWINKNNFGGLNG